MTKKPRKPKKAQSRPAGLEEWPFPLYITYEGKADLSIFDRFPEHTRLLGAIAGLWSTLEFVMGQLFENLLVPRETEATVIFYALGNHKARRDILKTTGKSRLKGNPDLLEKFDKAIALIAKRADRRNTLLHSAWIYYFDQDRLLRYSPRPTTKQPKTIFTDDEAALMSFVNKLKEVITLTVDLAFEVEKYLGSQKDPPESES